eukprot:13720570-Ditylum_brightwellii.AAC.1
MPDMKQNRDGRTQKNLSSMLKKSASYCHAKRELFYTLQTKRIDIKYNKLWNKPQEMERDGNKLIQNIGGYKPFMLLKQQLEQAQDMFICGYS